MPDATLPATDAPNPAAPPLPVVSPRWSLNGYSIAEWLDRNNSALKTLAIGAVGLGALIEPIFGLPIAAEVTASIALGGGLLRWLLDLAHFYVSTVQLG